MIRTLLFALAALAQAQIDPENTPGFPSASGSTMIRFGCHQIAIDRIDPLVDPGVVPSPHMHQIVGGNAFQPLMPSADIGELANCTTCSFSEDFSNYWTANVYFRARNGTYKRVPQVPNRFVSRSHKLRTLQTHSA